MAKLPDHGHCEHCGDPVAFGERFCSDTCSNDYSKEDRDARNKDIRFYGILVGIIIVAAVVVVAVKTLLP